MSVISNFKDFIYHPYYRRILKNQGIVDSVLHQENYDTINYSEAETVSLSFDNYRIIGGSKPVWAQNLIGEHKIRQPFYSIQRNALLIGEGATVINERNEILLDSIYNNLHSLIRYGNRKILATRKFYKVEKTIDLAISLVSPLSYSYFHWVAESLPWMEAYFDFVNKFGEKPKVVINSKSISFQYEYMKLMGIEDAQIVEWNHTKVRVERLIMPCFRATNCVDQDQKIFRIHSKSALNFLRSKLSIDKSKKELNVFVSRGDSSMRNILNETELLADLKTHNFQSVTLTNLSVTEQIDLFTRVNKVIFPHGAGQTNMIFTEKADIIELFPDQRLSEHMYHFFFISNIFSHNHKLLNTPCDGQNQNMIVDIDQVLAQLV